MDRNVPEEPTWCQVSWLAARPDERGRAVVEADGAEAPAATTTAGARPGTSAAIRTWAAGLRAIPTLPASRGATRASITNTQTRLATGRRSTTTTSTGAVGTQSHGVEQEGRCVDDDEAATAAAATTARTWKRAVAAATHRQDRAIGPLDRLRTKVDGPTTEATRPSRAGTMTAGTVAPASQPIEREKGAAWATGATAIVRATRTSRGREATSAATRRTRRRRHGIAVGPVNRSVMLAAIVISPLRMMHRSGPPSTLTTSLQSASIPPSMVMDAGGWKTSAVEQYCDGR
ncbi:MAG: hypothetical protein NT062_31660 [Proteobacteria bacterium]|nr:hypothetical protein [Pseudomonadota bacterium]